MESIDFTKGGTVLSLPPDIVCLLKSFLSVKKRVVKIMNALVFS